MIAMQLRGLEAHFARDSV